MFAIVEVASKQYKVSVGDLIEIPRVSRKKEMSLDKVLMTISGKDVEIGAPYLKNAKVICDVIGDTKGSKKVSFKFKRRKSYHRKIGFRELLTQVRVKDIKKE